HWDLEFPEVFIDLEHAAWKENGGFDAVIGNPPYGAAFTKADRGYLSIAYDSFQLDYDSYIFFLEKTVDLTKEGGCAAVIVPEVWLRLETNEKLRRKLLSRMHLEILWVTGRVFDEAVVYTCIPVLARGSKPFTNNSVVVVSASISLT